MNLKDPKLIALQFNEYINNQDLEGLTSLMTENHIFIDRNGNRYGDMVNGWKNFFENYPTYKNIFRRVESRDNIVILIGYAKWSNESPEKDHAIWIAMIENDHVAVWQIYEDTEENRNKLSLK